MKRGKKILSCALALTMLLQNAMPVLAVDSAVAESAETETVLVTPTVEDNALELPAQDLIDLISGEQVSATLNITADKSVCAPGEKVAFTLAPEGLEGQEIDFTCSLFLNGVEVEQFQQTETAFSYVPEDEGLLIAMVSAVGADGQTVTGFSPSVEVAQIRLMADAVSGDFSYSALNGTYCQITGYSGSETELIIPDTLDGYIVQSMADGVFRNNTTLTTITLPAYLESLSSYTFEGCTNLGQVNVNQSLSAVKNYAFQGCTALESIALTDSMQTIGQGAFENCTALTAVTLPEGLTSVSHYAFKGCTALESIALPDSVSTMGRSVFENCTSLHTVNYPKNWIECASNNGYTSGQGYIFAGCTALTKIEIPEGVAAIPDFAFRGCNNLEEVVLSSTLETIGSHAFYECSALKTITIPNSVTTIKDHAFYNCDSLTEVTVSNNLTSLGEYAFAENAALTEITLPGTLVSIPKCCFENSKGLTSIVLGEGTTAVNQSAFENCTGLTAVTLPESLNQVWHYAFKGCTALESINLPDSVNTMGRSVFENCTSLHTVNYPKSWSECASNNGYASGQGYIFAGCTALTKIEIPEGVTAIPDFAFRGCNNLEEVVLPSNLETIGSHAFYECSSLKAITIPDSVTTIKDHAFYNCDSLTKVVVSSNLTSLGEYSFAENAALTEIALPGTLVSIPKCCFENSKGLTSIVLGEGTTAVNQSAFENCTSLTNVTLPEGLSTVWHYAFKGCTALESITLPDSVSTMGRSVFENCTSLHTITYPKSWSECASNNGYASGQGYIFAGCTALKKMEIPEGVTAIPDFAFRGCNNLEEVILPTTLETIGSHAFYECSALKTITIPDSVTTIKDNAFYQCKALATVTFGAGLTTLDEYAFYGCTGLTRLVLPENLATIGSYAFQNCSGLRSIEVGKNTTTVGRGAFEGCTGITAVTLPDGLTEISHYAFKGCTSLAAIVLPDRITTIGTCAFENCSKLVTVNYPKSWNSCPSVNGYLSGQGNIFAGCTSLQEISVPEGVTSIPACAFRGCSTLEEIILPTSVTTIGGYAFSNCGYLEKIWIDQNVEAIADDAFSGSSALTIHGIAGSYAQEYAEANSIPFSTELMVLPAAGLSGQVQTEDGTPVAGVTVTLYDVAENEVEFTLTTDSSGLWSTEETLVGHTYRVYYYLAGYEITPQNVEYTVGENALVTETATAAKALDLPETADTDFTYTALNGAYCKITGYTGTATEVGVPSELGGLIVQSIADNVFKNNTTVTCVVLPSTVETVGSYLFAGCTSLTHVYLNQGLTNVSNYMFLDCTALESVALPGSIQKIGQGAFENCTALTTVTLPEGLTSISHYAFKGCTALESIVLPDSVSTMGRSVFENCTSLHTVNYPKNWSECASSNGYASGQGHIFAGCTALKKMEIPEGVTAIPDFAFRGCNNLEEVILPSNLETIGSHAFYECSALKTITIPDSVTTIKDHAFYNCDSLTEVTVSNNLTSLGEYAFAENAALTEIALPGTLVSIPKCCFENSKGLTSIVLGEGTIAVNQGAFENCTSLTNVTLPEGLSTVWHYAFKGCTALESITLPDSVSTMGRSVFENCTSLRAVNYPKNWSECASTNGYTSGQGYIFAGCTALKKMEIPEGVTAIPDFAFRGCNNLEEVILPTTLETIGSHAFYECSALKTITIPDSVTTIKDNAFYQCKALATVTFGAGLTTLGDTAFYGCTGLVRLDLPDNLPTIRNGAFQDCTGLRMVEVGASTERINDNAFQNCSGLNTLTLPETLKTIGHYAFDGCSALQEVILPDTVTSIGSRVFRNCVKLSSINYPLSWAECNSTNPNSDSGRGFVFEGCSALTRLEIPEGVTTIPAYAFRGCNKLQTIVIPSSLTTIGSRAFYGSGLKSVSLPETLTGIGDYAFAACSSLRTAYIPVTTEADAQIGTGAFAEFNKDLVITCCYATEIYYHAESLGITILPLDEHDHSMEAQNEHPATCIEDGYIDAVCSICGYHRNEMVAALGHDFAEEFTVDKEATCLEMGRKCRHCSRCTAVTDEEDIPAHGHEFTGWVVLKAPTVVVEGAQTRYCNFCEVTESEPVARLVLTEEMMESYGLVHFKVVHAQTLEPVAEASICIETADGDVTLITDSNGNASHILEVGKYPASIKAPGCKSRNIKINVKGGEQQLPDIGVSERDPVQVKLKHHLMTYDEILAAGIDPNAPGNTHVYRYILTITFRPELDLIGLMYMFNDFGQMIRCPEITFPEPDYTHTPGEGNGGRYYIGEPDRSEPDYDYGKGFGRFKYTTVDGEDVTVHITEKFLLIIYGEVKWLKEMFDVEMIILNASESDTIENAEAELYLPEGLSLATMRAEYDQQTLRQSVPVIEPGGTHTVHWYVCGDTEGSYDITASLDGMLMPFEEEFHYEYTAEDPIKVYAGSALLLTLRVPDVVYYGTKADISITLTNVSDRTLYNVSHTISNVVQKKVTYTRENGKTTVVEEELANKGVSTVPYVVPEFKPGDQLIIDMEVEIVFQAEQIKQKFRDILGEIKALSDLSNVVDAFDEAGSAAEDLSGFISDASSAIDAGKVAADSLEAAESFRQLTDYMDFGKGEGSSSPGLFAMLDDLVDSLPIKYVLENVSVETLKDNTTDIPWKIITYAGPPVNPLIPAGSISMSKLIYSIAVLLMGEQDVKVGGMTLVADYTGTKEAMEYVRYCWEQTAAIRAVDYTGDVTYRVRYVPAASAASLMSDQDAVTISVDNDTAKWEDGVLTFTGPGLIQVTPHTMDGGTLYVQAGDQEPKAYVIEVVEPHECSSDIWVTQVPATETTSGFQAKFCDICGEICSVRKTTSCRDHTFSEYVVEIAPTADKLGIETRKCTKCDVLEYRLTDTLPMNDVTELVTEQSGELVTVDDNQYLVVKPGMDTEELLSTLTNPELAVRTSSDGTTLDAEVLATGQKLTVNGVPGELTLVLPGDLDGDGTVTETEVNKVFAMSFTNTEGNGAAMIAADHDGNGQVSLKEAAQTAMSAAKIREDNSVLFLAFYDGNSCLAKVAEANETDVAADYQGEFDWTGAKLFVLDTDSAPLTNALCYSK